MMGADNGSFYCHQGCCIFRAPSAVLSYYQTHVATGYQVFSITSMLCDLIPINYFVTLYCAVYIVSPYVNRTMEGLSQTGRRRLLVTVFLLFSAWPFFVDLLEKWVGVGLYGLSSVGIMGSEQGCTFVNFLLCYMIGAYIRQSELKISRLKLAGVAAAIIVILFFWAKEEILLTMDALCWNYENPLCLILAAVWLMIFLQIDFSSRIVNELAKSVFSCVLCHIWFFHYLDIPSATQRGTLYLLLHILASGLGLYLIAWVIDRLYHLLADLTFHRLIDKIDAVVPLSPSE